MKNPITEQMVNAVYEKARKEKSKLWWRIAKELSAPRRRRPEVNLSKLSEVTKEGEWVIVPGRVLGTGSLEHKLNIVAFSYSAAALDKLKKQGTAVTITEFIAGSAKPKGMRIIK